MNVALRRSRIRLVLVVACSGIFAISACGGSDSSEENSSSTSASSQQCLNNAAEFLEDWEKFPTTLPKSPPARYTQLKEAPEAGKTVVYMRPNIPATQTTFRGVSDAAAALKWNAKAVNYDGSITDYIAKFSGVVAAKPDFILGSGLPAGALQRQIEQAKDAGVTMILNSVNDKPVSVPGLGGTGDGVNTAKTVGKVQAFKMLSESNCSGNTVLFTLDFPVLKTVEASFKKVVKENCEACDVDVVTVQTKDIGTPAATAQMVSKLQSSPDTKYAYTIIGDLAGGLAQGLKTAGVDGVSIFGEVPTKTSIADLRNGTNAWWVNESSYISGLDMVDNAARITVTGEPQGDPGGYPLVLLTKDTVPSGEEAPVIPENILELYKESWGVS